MEEWRTSLDHSTSYLITDEGTTFPEPPIKLEGCIKSPIFHPSSKRLQPVISITPQVATTENGSLLLSSTSRLEIDYHHRFERNIHSPIRCNLTSNFHRKRKKAFNVSLPLHTLFYQQKSLLLSSASRLDIESITLLYIITTHQVQKNQSMK